MNSAIINTELQFRPAQKSDCWAISSLYSISSDGVADYIWTKLAQPGEDLLSVGQRRYERENTVFSYRNCTIATLGETIIGMLVAFPMIVDADTEPEQDPILAPYSKLEANNSYYICGVAVFPEYRNRGIGTRLMTVAEQQAATKGFTQLSLIVFEQNKGAKRLYERLGYREIAREPIVPHPLIHYSGDAILIDLSENLQDAPSQALHGVNIKPDSTKSSASETVTDSNYLEKCG